MSLGLDEEARLAAAARLRGQASRKALDAALASLGDRSWRIRKAAIEAIIAHPDREAALQGLIAGLGSEANAGERNSAAEALVRLGAAAVPALLGRLADPDPDVRKFVVDVLGEIADRSTVPALVGALSDGDENVRTSAAEALGKIGDERAIEGLRAALEGGDVWIQHAVLGALGRLGRPLPPALLARLAGHSQLRRSVYDLIGRARDTGAFDLALAGLGDRGRSAREAAIGALWALREADPALDRRIGEALGATADGAARREAVASALDSAAAGVRVAAGGLLAVAGDGRGVPALVEAVGDDRLRPSALAALRAAPGTAASALVAMLGGPDEERREMAAILLGELPGVDERGAAALQAALQDPVPSVRGAAAVALGRAGVTAAAGAVAALLADESEDVRVGAVEALALLAALEGPELLLDRAAPLLTAADPGHRRTAVTLLGRLGDFPGRAAAEVQGRLAFALKDPDAGVRRAAAAALGRLGSPDGVEPLLLALADEEADVRIEAAGALGRIGSVEAVEPLGLLLADPDPWIRAAALEALGAIGAPTAFPAVVSALAATEPPVVLTAIEAAAAIGGDAAVPHLLPLLRSPDPEIVKGVIRSLAPIGDAQVTAALLPLLSASHWSVRAAAAEALGRRRAPEAHPALAARLAVEEDDVAREALRSALEALG